MKKILFIIAILISGEISAQELIKPNLPPVDSAYLNDSILIPENVFINQIIPFQYDLFRMETSTLKLPEFDFSRQWLHMKQDYNYLIFNPEGNSNINFPYAMMPFTSSAAIFNQAAYKLSDKFTFGGNNFGAKSIFSSPFPNQGLNNFDVRGASMFLEYKVSKKVKIQTSVSITNQRY
ncbi:MAG: hypothetical protein JW833_16990 [Prolixibacteraceae bacterium]|nr:hypothetical protein [Prolixibacteraceae bacterium]